MIQLVKNVLVAIAIPIFTAQLEKSRESAQGGLIDREFPIALCKLMPYDSEAKKGSRVATAEKDGKKVRKLKASGKII